MSTISAPAASGCFPVNLAFIRPSRHSVMLRIDYFPYYFSTSYHVRKVAIQNDSPTEDESAYVRSGRNPKATKELKVQVALPMGKGLDSSCPEMRRSSEILKVCSLSKYLQ